MGARVSEQVVELRVGFVEGVYDEQLGQAEARGVLPGRIGADAQAVAGMDHDHRGVADAQRAEALADEVGVAGRIEDVELLAQPFGVEQRAMHRDLMLLLAGVVIRGGRAGGDAAHPAEAAGTGEHGLGEHGLAGGRVAEHGEAAQIGGGVFFHEPGGG